MAPLLSQPFAGVGVADRQREEADREGEHQNVHHGVLLVGAWSWVDDHRDSAAGPVAADQERNDVCCSA